VVSWRHRTSPEKADLLLESCRVWEDNDEHVKREAQESAEKLGALLADPDSGYLERQQFDTSQILGRCDLPGVTVYNNPKMLDVPTEPYHLPPRENLQSSTHQ